MATLGAQIKERLAKQRELDLLRPNEFKSWFCRAVEERITAHSLPKKSSKHYVGRVPFSISDKASIDDMRQWLQEVAEQEELEAFLERGSKVGFVCDCDNGCDGCAVTCYIKI